MDPFDNINFSCEDIIKKSREQEQERNENALANAQAKIVIVGLILIATGVFLTYAVLKAAMDESKKPQEN